MMRQLFFVFSCFVVLLVAGASVEARVESSQVVTNNAVSQLFSEREGIVPGETILIGFHQKLREGWHVYWENPGESGLPLDFKWTLPLGFSAGDIQYPTPHQMPLEMLMNYGHEGEPTFLVELTASADAIPGSVVELVLKATWLICDDICVPEEGEFFIRIPVVAEPAQPDTAGFPIIENAKLDLPVEADFTAGYFDLDGVPYLRLDTDELDGRKDVHFFPFVSALIKPSGEETKFPDADGLLIRFSPDFEYDPAELEALDGVVTVGKGRNLRGYIVRAPKREVPADVTMVISAAAPGAVNSAGAVENAPGLIGILWLAFLGGVILNIMPCVFPVVFIKAASFAKAAQEDKATIQLHGILYTAGVLVTFLALAGILILLRAGGEQVGWGFHLQSPIVVSVFAMIILLVGLNLAGLFEIGTSLQGAGADLASKGGKTGAFFTGLLAVAVAAPCIGPFLGVPVGFALVQPAFTGLLVFAVMGLGLALPYLLISLMPGLAGLLPKPGPWMETFKQLLSFAMFATLIWLIWTLTLQAGPDGLVLLLCALLLASFAAWIFGRSQRFSGGWISRGLAILALIASVMVISDIKAQPQAMGATTAAPGEGDLSQLPTAIFGETALAEYQQSGIPVFVDFTAAWCVTCQVNKQRVLNQKPVIDAFHEKGVIYMVADWTLQDPEITAALEAQGRSGVPLYLFYPPGAEKPEVLPQLLSVKLMLETFSAL